MADADLDVKPGATSQSDVDTAQPMEAPGDIVANRIVARLLAEGLVGLPDSHTCVIKLKAGTAASADWRLWVENQLERGAGDVGD